MQKKIADFEHPTLRAFCMADTNYKINEIFFNSNTVYAFFVFMLVSSIEKECHNNAADNKTCP